MAAPGDAGIVDTLELRGEQVSVEPIYGGGRLNVLLIANPNEIKESGVATARSDYEALVSGEPVIRATFDIYLSENTLAYAKEPCVPADTAATFFLHVIPSDPDALPDARKQHGFDNRDFHFDGRGVIFNGKCMAEVNLPEYDITRIRTGQYVPGEGQVWKAEFPFSPAE